jgi:hypothetical protein
MRERSLALAAILILAVNAPSFAADTTSNSRSQATGSSSSQESKGKVVPDQAVTSPNDPKSETQRSVTSQSYQEAPGDGQPLTSKSDRPH